MVINTLIEYWFLWFLGVALCVYSLVLTIRYRRARDEQALFHNFLKFSPALVFIKDRDGRYTHVSTSYANLIGRAPMEMIGSTADNCFPLEEYEGFRLMYEMDQTILRERIPQHIEAKIPTASGLRDFLVTKFPISNKNRLEYIIGLSSDITDLRKNERRLSEVESQYLALTNQEFLGVYILRDDLKLAYVNECFAKTLGYSVEELLALEFKDWIAPMDRMRMQMQVKQRIAHNIGELAFEVLVKHRQGHVVPLSVQSRLSEMDGANVFIGVTLDMTDYHMSQQQQALSNVIFHNSSEGILMTDSQARILIVNNAFTQITGYLPEDACGRISRMFRIDHTGRAINAQMMQALEQTGVWQGEFLDRRKNGELYPVWLAISAVRDDFGEVLNYVCIFSDITQRKHAEDRLQFLATHDTLTRLLNRASFIDQLNKSVDLAREHNGKLSVMFIDLDRFKLINDSFGHSTGDDLLRMIAARLVYAVGEHGHLARFGGDEFTVMFENDCSMEFLQKTAETILVELEQPLKLENYELFVTASIGIARFPTDAQDSMSLLKNADMAMYYAKERGKNTFAFFTESMNADAIERLNLENGLRAALERNEFALVFQPQVDPFKQTLEGVEALLRWNSNEIGAVSPVRFIPVAEDSGMISAIGEWVINEACRQLIRWDNAGIHVPKVSVNLSPRQFEDVLLIEKILSALKNSGVAPERFEVEVTESTLMNDPTEAIRVLKALKEIGVTVAIDDFGTGYSSLSNLKHLPLDCLKIDRAFINGLPEDSDNAAITEAIIAMSRKLRLSIVVEGVENEAQLQFLMRCGCEVIQGYFYSPPILPDKFPQFLSDLKTIPPKPWIPVERMF